MAALWRVERTEDKKFPLRIAIEQNGRVLFAVRAREPWPAPGGNVFCLRERAFDAGEPLDEIERVPVTEFTRIGPKLMIVLDRPKRKRCEFLILEKPYKDGAGAYEQVFFRTESAIRAHKTRGRVELSHSPALDVVIDSAERYPWSFPAARITRRKLPVGDYALEREAKLLAVVERKSLDNLLSDFSSIKALHQQWVELAAYARAAVVIEAQYGDFLNQSKARNWPASHMARVLGEIAALHPKLPMVFAGNRKMANIWTQQFFRAVAAEMQQSLFNTAPKIEQLVARYQAGPSHGGVDQDVRHAAMVQLPAEFSGEMLRDRFPELDANRLHRVLQTLRKEGKLELEGRGRAARWRRVS